MAELCPISKILADKRFPPATTIITDSLESINAINNFKHASDRQKQWSKGRPLLNMTVSNNDMRLQHVNKSRGEKRSFAQCGNAIADKAAKKARIGKDTVHIRFQEIEAKFYLKHNNDFIPNDYKNTYQITVSITYSISGEKEVTIRYHKKH